MSFRRSRLPNLFYKAPLILDGDGSGQRNRNGKAISAAVEWMISQLKEARARDWSGKS